MRWKLHLGSSNLVLLSLYEFRGSDSSPFSLPSRVFKRRRKHKGGEKPKGDISRNSYDTDCIFDYFSDSSSLGSGMSHRSNATPYTWKMTWSLAFLVILSLGKSSLIHIRCLICSTDCDLNFFSSISSSNHLFRCDSHHFSSKTNWLWADIHLLSSLLSGIVMHMWGRCGH